MNTRQDFIPLNHQRQAAVPSLRRMMKQPVCSRPGAEKPARPGAADCVELTPGTILVLDEGRNQRVQSERSSIKPVCRENAEKVTSSGLSLWLVQGASWFWADGACKPAETSLGVELIARAQARGVPFEAATCSALFGTDGMFRAELNARQIQYMVEVPASQRLYLLESIRDLFDPVVKEAEMLAPRPYRAEQLCGHPHMNWQRHSVRISERYVLNADFASQRVQTVWQAATGQLHTRQEWLVIRRNAAGKCDFALSNAPAETPLSTLARYKAQRFFTDCQQPSEGHGL